MDIFNLKYFIQFFMHNNSIHAEINLCQFIYIYFKYISFLLYKLLLYA